MACSLPFSISASLPRPPSDHPARLFFSWDLVCFDIFISFFFHSFHPFLPAVLIFLHFSLSLIGGHTSEMLRLVSGLDKSKFTPRVYVSTDTDNMSEWRAREAEEGCVDVSFDKIPRSREVKQSWLSTILSTLRTLRHTPSLLIHHCPQLVSLGLEFILIHSFFSALHAYFCTAPR